MSADIKTRNSAAQLQLLTKLALKAALTLQFELEQPGQLANMITIVTQPDSEYPFHSKSIYVPI